MILRKKLLWITDFIESKINKDLFIDVFMNIIEFLYLRKYEVHQNEYANPFQKHKK